MGKIIFFNTGWMDFYAGISNDSITGGGKHINQEGWGGEIYNFKNFKDHVYGYVQPKLDKKHGNPSTVKIEKIGASKTDKEISDVTVIWTARNPHKGGTYIIGWYLHATVYREAQVLLENTQRKVKGDDIGYYTITETKNAKLLPVDERVFPICRQKKNCMGQSNVWYAENNPELIKRVFNYIHKGIILDKRSNANGFARQLDPFKRIEVEKSAIRIVVEYYQNIGYQVKSVERDNVGWDLTATIESTELKLEVKGLSGTCIATELTPNEFKNLKTNMESYRLCLVTEALTTHPTLQIFRYSKDIGKWTSEAGIILAFEEITSARIYVQN